MKVAPSEFAQLYQVLNYRRLLTWLQMDKLFFNQ